MDSIQDLETTDSDFCQCSIGKKELEMLSRLLKTFGMKKVKAVADVYPCDGNMAKNLTSSSFNWTER